MFDENTPGTSSPCTVLEPSMASPRSILLKFVTELRDAGGFAAGDFAGGRESLSARLDIEVTELGYRRLVAPIQFAMQFEEAPLSDAVLADLVDEWLGLLP